MGQLIDGAWHAGDARAKSADGHFRRKDSAFRDWIEDRPDARFRPEPGRYHLYVSLACPWAHRTLIFRALKGLEAMIGVTVVHPVMLDQGWSFEAAFADPLFGADHLHQIYTRADPSYTGRVSVPVLWDTAEATIVCNESSEIIRMFNGAFDGAGATPGDYYPVELRDRIDAINTRVYETVNNGVYRCGFATTQAAYEDAFDALFGTLDWLEDILSRTPYLLGDRVTEADWRLFPTLARFDAVYHGHFKCNRHRLIDFPNLWAYTRALYQWPGVADTVDFTHIKQHYYASHRSVNPTGIVPKGPVVDFTEPHDRGGPSLPR
ncbi:MAG: glutathione S-transferase family protein [Alphaproteobacteria bacterium]|nr:glutathione S-transferase family protein [Alphaproteobacteria bacterium]